VVIVIENSHIYMTISSFLLVKLKLIDEIYHFYLVLSKISRSR